jgi:hypothetical protein
MEMTERVARLINNTVDHAITVNDMADIDFILSGKPFPEMPKSKLEAQTFSTSYFEFVRNGHDNALKYLIFSYNINEETSVFPLAKLGIDIDKRVKQMFQTRNLNKELNTNLKNNNEYTSKKPKV